MPDSHRISYVIEVPRNMNESLRQQFIELVTAGGQIRKEYVKVGLHRAELVGMVLSENKVIATCCLKNSTDNYKEGVFISAVAPQSPRAYLFDLGYIATHPQFGGEGHCQALLRKFMPLIQEKAMFSTTRKPEMVHILKKFDFY